MSDFRNSNFDYRDPDDPLRRDARLDLDARAANAAWGWIAAAVFLVVVLAVAFGIGHQGQQGTKTASNDVMPPPPAMSRMNPPATAPAPVTPAPLITPAPSTPAQQDNK